MKPRVLELTRAEAFAVVEVACAPYIGLQHTISVRSRMEAAVHQALAAYGPGMAACTPRLEMTEDARGTPAFTMHLDWPRDGPDAQPGDWPLRPR